MRFAPRNFLLLLLLSLTSCCRLYRVVKTCAVPRIVSHRDDPAGQSSSGNVVRCVLTATHGLSYSNWRGSGFTSAGKRTFHDTVIIMHLATLLGTHVLATRGSRKCFRTGRRGKHFFFTSFVEFANVRQFVCTILLLVNRDRISSISAKGIYVYRRVEFHGCTCDNSIVMLFCNDVER